MELVVSPVLHNSDPVTPVAVNTELPQSFIMDMPGVAGIAFGAASWLANKLVQPSTDCDTV